MKYTLTGPARVVNWFLVAALTASSIGGLVLFRDSPRFAALFVALPVLLLVGVSRCRPSAYIGLMTLSFLGIATALNREDVLVAALNACVMSAAIFVRNRLQARETESVAPQEAQDEQA